MSPEGIKRAIAADKREREETRRTEQAKADRMALAGGHGKAQAERYGSALLLSMFAACLTPDLSGEDAVGIIGQVYAAEAKVRREQAHPRRQACGTAPRSVH